MNDVIVIGLGAMGSAAVYHLAARHQRVLGLDRFTPPHSRGSSHGETRVIHQAHYEHQDYVPLAQHSYTIWKKLERETGRRLLSITGNITMGSENSEMVRGSIESAEANGLDYEVLDASTIGKRFPVLQCPGDTVALFEKSGGWVRCEEAVQAYLDQALDDGAALHFNEAVHTWRIRASGVVEVTTGNAVYEAEQLVITPGPWFQTLSKLEAPVSVSRQVQYWFQPVQDALDVAQTHRCPFLWDIGNEMALSSVPAVKDAAPVKVGLHYKGPETDPGTIDRTVGNDEIETMRRCINGRVRGLDGELSDTTTCMYTNTPDGHFIIGHHPDHPQVVLAGGFCGHGFKFVPVVGEITADLVTKGHTDHPIDLFQPERF